ncbi:MAG: hypothetical protein U1A78_04290 [Polyangia bacterium]
MAPRYVPQNDARLVAWLENFQTANTARGKSLKFDDATIKAKNELAASLVAAIRNDEKKYAEWQSAVAHTAEVRDQVVPELVRYLDRAATADGWSAEAAAAFQAVNPAQKTVRFDDTFKPSFRATVQGKKVRILWTRGNLDGVRIESRLAGESEWAPLGIDMRPPFDDPRPLCKPGVPELREYRLIGVHNDQDVGTPSDIVRITVGD